MELERVRSILLHNQHTRNMILILQIIQAQIQKDSSIDKLQQEMTAPPAASSLGESSY